MHVALFNRSFHPDTLATGQLFTELCVGLVADYGCRVTVVAGPAPSGGDQVRPAGAVFSREMHCGVEILRSKGTRYSKERFAGRALNYVSYFLAACIAGQRLDRPDIIVAATDPPIIGLAAWLAARRFGVPLVMVYQDIFPEVAVLLEDFHSDLVNSALQATNRFLVRRAAMNVVLGETMRRRLIDGKRADPERTFIIANWADCSQIQPGPRKNAFSREYGLDEKFVVMHSGNVGLSQNLDCIVEVAELLRSFDQILLVIVGDGVKKASLIRQAADLGLKNVLFLPYQPKSTLQESFAAADMFIVSLKRGLAGYIVPSKLYGILAAGRPYVAAVEEDSEVTAVTRQHECGLLAEPGNARQIADCILTLYHDQAMAGRLGKNARNAALEFDKPTQIRAYFDLFQRLAKRRERT